MSAVQDLTDAGFTQPEITAYIKDKRNTLLSAGFSQSEIDNYLGIPTFDDKPLMELASQLQPSHMREMSSHTFDVEGSGYDEKRAKELIQKYPLTIPKPDSYQGQTVANENSFQAWEWIPEKNEYELHEASFDPETGMLLKGLKYKTIDKTLEAEEKLGHEIYKANNGRYYWRNKGNNEQPTEEVDISFREALAQGFKSSVSGLLTYEEVPEVKQNVGTFYRITTQAGMLAGDFPFMVLGAGLGSTTGPAAFATAPAGAFGLPAGLRKVLIDKYSKGEVRSFSEFWERMTAAVWETLKGQAVGAATGTAGKFAPGIVKLPAEVGTMVTAGAALEGEVPEPREFLDAAILVGGLHGATKVAGKLQNIYTETGRRPTQVIKDVETNPEIIEEVNSKNRIVPNVYKRFIQPIKEKITKPKQTIESGTPEEKVLNRISIDESSETKQPVIEKLHESYTRWIDEFHPIKRAVVEMSKDVPFGENPYYLTRLLRGVTGIGDHFLEFSPIDFKTRENVGKSLKEILKPVKNLDKFRAFSVSKRNIELSKRGIETGIDLEASKQVVKNNPEYESAFKELVKYQDYTLKYLRDSGIISKESYANMKTANKDFVPYYRIVEKDVTGFGKQLQAKQPIKQIKGSERILHDPLESIIKNTYLFTTLAEKNNAGLALIDLAKKTGWEKIKKARPNVRKITVSPEELSQKLGFDVDSESIDIFRPDNFSFENDIISVFRNGKRESYKVPEDIAKAFSGMEAKNVSSLIKLLSYPSKLLRAGAILSPEFVARNPLRDQVSAFVFSKYGFIPGYDFFKGVGHLFNQDKIYQEWIKSGGMNAMLVSMDRKYLQKNLKELTKGFTVRNVIKHPVEALRILSEYSEQGTRIGVFERSLKKGATPKEAGFESREASLDFGRRGGGSAARAMNLLVAFFNANLQGTDKMIRTFKDRPLESTAKVVAGITLPSIMLRLEQQWIMKNQPDSEMAKKIRNLSDWEKDLFWIVPVGDTLWRLPKPFEVGIIFGTMPEKFVDFMIDKEVDIDSTLGALVKGLAPSFLPTATLPLIENWGKRSFFTDRPIVPARRENLLPELQYTNYTTELSKAIGRIAGQYEFLKNKEYISPAKLENVVRGWSGGLGKYVLDLSNLALQKAGALPDPVKPTPTLSDMPFIKGFTLRYPTSNAKSIQDFYDSYELASKRLQSFKQLAVKEFNIERAINIIEDKYPVPLNSIYDAMSNMHQVVNLVYMNENFTAEEKRQIIDSIYSQMIDFAEVGNKIVKEIDKLEQTQ